MKGTETTTRVLLVKPEKNLWFPVGYAYLYAVWKRAGFHVDFVDLDKDSLKKVEDFLRTSRYAAVCAGGLIPSYNSIREIMRLAAHAAPHVARVVGGPLVNNIPPHYLFDDIGAHYAIKGEGEESSLALLKRIACRGIKPCPDIPGVYSKDPAAPKGWSGGLSRKPCDFSAIPTPDYSFWNQTAHHGQAGAISYDFYPILAGRGCLGSCAFCSPPAGAYRNRDPLDVVREISSLKNIGAKKIYFVDEMFFDSFEKIKFFCNAYKKINIPYQWECNMRVDGPLEALPMMREHGCTHVNFGFESANDRVLAAMKKRITHAMQLKAAAAAEDAGIIWQALWMAGNYSETQAELQESFDFFRAQRQVVPAVLITYPGTLNWVRAKKKNLIKDELHYIESLQPLFVGPLFSRISRMINGTLPYLNISDMDNTTFFTSYLKNTALQIQGMEIADPRLEGEADALQVKGTCPKCGGTVTMPVQLDQPFNIHLTRCPHCLPLWLHISPLKLPCFTEKLAQLPILLQNRRRIAVLDDNEHSAAFFLLKNYLGLKDGQVGCFIKTSGFSCENVLYTPVLSAEEVLASGEFDCVLVAARHTARTEDIAAFLHRHAKPGMLLVDAATPNW